MIVGCGGDKSKKGKPVSLDANFYADYSDEGYEELVMFKPNGQFYLLINELSGEGARFAFESSYSANTKGKMSFTDKNIIYEDCSTEEIVNPESYKGTYKLQGGNLIVSPGAADEEIYSPATELNLTPFNTILNCPQFN